MMKRIGELKAECQARQAENSVLAVECERLKAEVERLTERLGGVRLIVTEEMYDELNTKYLEQQHELQNIALTARQILDEKIDLKEQVERLTKAGDALAGEAIRLEYNNYWSEYEKVEDVCIDEVEAWHKAKGVQS